MGYDILEHVTKYILDNEFDILDLSDGNLCSYSMQLLKDILDKNTSKGISLNLARNRIGNIGLIF